VASQRALKIVGSDPKGEGVVATLELACGCIHTFDIESDRLLETVNGDTIAVGKYPCPKGHPLARR
jgi:hypothetical protein